MNNSSIRILLTGATGIVGREIMYELLEKFAEKTLQGKLFLLIRPNQNMSGIARAHALLRHAFAPESLKKYPFEVLLSYISVIEKDIADFSADDIPNEDKTNFYLLHSAASTNLANTEAAEKIIKNDNFLATERIFYESSTFIRKFIFISTAFAAGIVNEPIEDDYLAKVQFNWRNPYEKYKILAEKMLAEKCAEKHIALQIFRPSVVCGRLLKEPKFYTPNFNVFYTLGRFVVHFKNRIKSGMKIRLQANQDNTINIVASDFVAKVICENIFNDEIRQLNITADKPTKIGLLLSMLPKETKIDCFEFSPQVPEEMNAIEKIYVKTVGSQIKPYFAGEEIIFSPKNRKLLCPTIEEPDVTENAKNLVNFALRYQFNDIG